MTARDPTTTRPILIAIGDLHGHVCALDRLIAAAHARYGIVGRRGGMEAGVTLLTTGDHIDRGDHGLEVISRLQRLARGPGRVVSLLGNHELLALEALDVAAHIARTSSAADPISEYEALTLHGRNGGGEFIREFGAEPRAALRSYIARMRGTGDVGRWIRSLRPAHFARIAGHTVLFTHGDVAEALRDAARLDRYLARVKRRIRTSSLDAGGARAKWGHADFGGESIFWDRSFRSIALDPDGDPAAVCRALGVDFIVSGHTPHARISAYGDRIFRIDVGMTPAYGENEPQALVLTESGASALHADGTETSIVSFDERLSPAA